MALAAVNNLDRNSYDREQLERQLSRWSYHYQHRDHQEQPRAHPSRSSQASPLQPSHEQGETKSQRKPIFGLQRSSAHPIVVNCCGCQPHSNYVCDRRLLVAHINSVPAQT